MILVRYIRHLLNVIRQTGDLTNEVLFLTGGPKKKYMLVQILDLENLLQ